MNTLEREMWIRTATAALCIWHAATLKGFGGIFDLSPKKGSMGGGTEVHVAGTGFGSISKLTIGGKECKIFMPSVKDGELFCYTPEDEFERMAWHDREVKAHFTSGHVASYHGSFQYHFWMTPLVDSVNSAAPVAGNVSFSGNLVKMLQGDSDFMFKFLREKRNATEILHAYLGSGLDVMGDKSGPDEFRLEFVETKDIKHGVGQVKAGMMAGHYNFTYVLDDAGTGNGYGKGARVPHYLMSSLQGTLYDVEVYPSIHELSMPRKVGYLGGAEVTLASDALGASERPITEHSVMLAGVPCTPTSIHSFSSKDYLTCTAGPANLRMNKYPDWTGYKRTPSTTSIITGIDPYWSTFARHQILPVNADNNMEQLYIRRGCTSATSKELFLNAGVSLELCYDECFRAGTCKAFWFRGDVRTSGNGKCYMCQTDDATGMPTGVETVGGGWDAVKWGATWIGNGGIYKLKVTGVEYLNSYPQGAGWKLLSATQKCSGSVMLENTKFFEVNACASLCSMSSGCKYFGIKQYIPDSYWAGVYQSNYASCVLYAASTCTLESSAGYAGFPTQNAYEITKVLPSSPIPLGFLPGTRGVYYRVWNSCPSDARLPFGCNDEKKAPFSPLYAGFNPEYAKQTSMFEGVRSDYSMGPFGTAPDTEEGNASGMVRHDPSVPYRTLAEASGDHGLIFEIWAYFKAPYTAKYSFYSFGFNSNDMYLSSNNDDPSDFTKAAETPITDFNRCQTGPGVIKGRLGCAIYAKTSEVRAVEGKPVPGTEYTDSNLATFDIEAGERRFMSRRILVPENVPYQPSSRRRHNEAAAVRIHNPDLSGLSDHARENLAQYQSWPECYSVKVKWTGWPSGVWKFGLKDPKTGEVTYSGPIKYQFREGDLQQAWDAIKLPDGTKGRSEVFFMATDYTSYYAFQLISWRPFGNVPDVVLDLNSMVGDITVEWKTITDGNDKDLFIFPIPGNMLEVPDVMSQATLSSMHIQGRFAHEGVWQKTSNKSVSTTTDHGSHNNNFDFSSTAMTSFTCKTTTKKYRYIRFTSLETSANWFWKPKGFSLAEMSFWNYDASGTATELDMTGATPSENFDFNSDGGTDQFAKLFDNNVDTFLHGEAAGSNDPGVLTIDMGAGKGWTPSSWRMVTGKNDAGTVPAKFKLEVSEDNTNYEMVLDQSWRTFPQMVENNAYKTGNLVSFPSDLETARCGPLGEGMCVWGMKYSGTTEPGSAYELDSAQVYNTWHECQMRCCYDNRCQSIAWDSSTKQCKKFSSSWNVFWKESATSWVSNLVTPSHLKTLDGYEVAPRGVKPTTDPLDTLPGHKSVQDCKKACNALHDPALANESCHSFSWSESGGCSLYSDCVTGTSEQTEKDFVTYFQRSPYSCEGISIVPTSVSPVADHFLRGQYSVDPYTPDGDNASSLDFVYLSLDESPQISEVLVNGAAGSPGSLAIGKGDTIVLNGKNFLPTSPADVYVLMGETKFPVTGVTPTSITFTGQMAVYAKLNMKVMVGWMGWADFGPLIKPTDGKPRAQVGVTYGGGKNVITFTSPKKGSILGGNLFNILGEGFKTPASLNTVEVMNAGTKVGDCKMVTAKMTELSCILPEGTSGQEVTLSINGVSSNDKSVPISYTYDPQQTPQIILVTPATLSYAVTRYIELHGSMLGTRNAKVSFGPRVCRVVENTMTKIKCQMRRSAAALKEFKVKPLVQVPSLGYAQVAAGVDLDTRFEIYSVSPSGGSQMGGTEVTISGIGFSEAAVTSSRTVALLGTYGGIKSWTPSQIVLVTPEQQLNTNKVEVKVNLIAGAHMCGAGGTAGDCLFSGIGADFTPEITAVSQANGVAGDELTLTVAMPTGYGAKTDASKVQVWMGASMHHSCTVNSVTNAGDTLTVKVTVPEIEASSVPIKMMVQPLGYAKFKKDVSDKFTSNLIVSSMTPTQGSLGGGPLVITGKGFSTETPRHFVQIGGASTDDQLLFCYPTASTYTELRCTMGSLFKAPSWVNDFTKKIKVSLWDDVVADDPLLAFGNRDVGGCMHTHDDWSHYNTQSVEECALRCLTTEGCVSFEWRPSYAWCMMSKTSFTNCPATDTCTREPEQNCVYWELATEFKPAFAVTKEISGSYTYKRSLTPALQYTWNAKGEGSRYVNGYEVVSANLTKCARSNAAWDPWNDYGYKYCCYNEGKADPGFPGCNWMQGDLCNWDAGKCSGNLECVKKGCYWNYELNAAQTYGGKTYDCCSFVSGKGKTYGPAWKVGDMIMSRITSQFPAADLTAAQADPSGGTVKLTFDGVNCPIRAIYKLSDQSFHDIECILPEIPGGLPAKTVLNFKTVGVVTKDESWTEEEDYVFLPLEVSSVKAPSQNIGGGWEIEIDGTGFAPTGLSDSVVEVQVCGKPCDITSATYNKLTCTTPLMKTPQLLSDEIIPMDPRVLSLGAGLVGPGAGAVPMCFSGRDTNDWRYGTPMCVKVFDGDTELQGGQSGAFCTLGIDFGPDTYASIEQIRWFPRFVPLDAHNYKQSRFEVNDIYDTPECDELTYGWRGTEYRGCQEVSSTGNACMKWEEAMGEAYITKHPELKGHSFCRNPDPSLMNGIFCYIAPNYPALCSQMQKGIKWKTVHDIKSAPKMLWNTINFDTPVVARIVRFVGVGGDCRMNQIEIIGQLVAKEEACPVAVRNVRKTPLRVPIDLHRAPMIGADQPGFEEMASGFAYSPSTVPLKVDTSPIVKSLMPFNGTARGGTEVTITGTNFGTDKEAVTVILNRYECSVMSVTATEIKCTTGKRDKGIFPPEVIVKIAGVGKANVASHVAWRYLDRWSEVSTWKDEEPPEDGDMVVIPKGQAIMLDEDSPLLKVVTVEGVLVFDNKDLHFQAEYVWVKGGTFEIGTEMRPFLHRALVTLHGNKYEAIRLPIVGAKCLAVSNDKFTIREGGDKGDVGDIGTLSIHGAPRRTIMTQLSETAHAGAMTIYVKNKVDWSPGDEILITATETPPKKHEHGVSGAPPVDFEDETAIIASVADDANSIVLTKPLEFDHLATSFTRPDGETLQLAAEVALLSRNVKIQGDARSEINSWGGHTMVAFGGRYQLMNAEFYRMGQTGELSRYPIHFHVSADFGKQCYAKFNSIHNSFQRAVTIHSTNYVTVQGNVAYKIIGHMYFVETGMEKYNKFDGNLGVGAIPLLSGMLESDVEPSAFWTATPNNVWTNNIAVTGSDGWYFQLPDHPISHSVDVYKESECPKGDRLGDWNSNRCHHITGSCIRVYNEWRPFKDPCQASSGVNPQVLFNTTCWGVGFQCFNSMFAGSIHQRRINSFETGLHSGGSDVWYQSMNKGISYDVAKWPQDSTGIATVEDGVFVGVLPENLATWTKRKWKVAAIEMPADENFQVRKSHFFNYFKVPILLDCSMCYNAGFSRQGAFTYTTSGLHFHNSSKRVWVAKKGIFHDQDGTLFNAGNNTYTTWADPFNIVDGCTVVKQEPPASQPLWPELGVVHDSGQVDESEGIFHVVPEEAALIHVLRDFSFIHCKKPIRKFLIAYPSPDTVYNQPLTITNYKTGKSGIYQYEDKKIFGWCFPTVVMQQQVVQVNPLVPGLDLDGAALRYGFINYLEDRASTSVMTMEPVKDEYVQLLVKSSKAFDHYKLIAPDWEMVATRRGGVMGSKAKSIAKYYDAMYNVDKLKDPKKLLQLTHGMLADDMWGMVFHFPPIGGQIPWDMEPYSARFEAAACPAFGCLSGLPALGQTWPTSTKWSEKFKDKTLDEDTPVEIGADEWIIFDEDDPVTIANLSIFGKLSFDDAGDRTLETGFIRVYGLLEIGNENDVFGQDTNAVATIRLGGKLNASAPKVDQMMAASEGKMISVLGEFTAYGKDVGANNMNEEAFGFLHSPVSAGDSSLCMIPYHPQYALQTAPAVGVNTKEWPANSEIVISGTEYDTPFEDVEVVTLTKDGEWDSTNQCWKMEFAPALKKGRYGGSFPMGSGGSQTESLRALVGLLTRNIVIEPISVNMSNQFGGHVEVFDTPTMVPPRAGKVELVNVQFHQMGKGGLKAALDIKYTVSHNPPPVNLIKRCSFTDAFETAIEVDSQTCPVRIRGNVFSKVMDGGILSHTGSRNLAAAWNVIIGVDLSPRAGRAVAELGGNIRVKNYAGIRLDETPARFRYNFVANSNDMGYMYRADVCTSGNMVHNEAFANTVGFYIYSQRTGGSQCITHLRAWKNAHIGIYLADVKVPIVMRNIMLSDNHIGILPYYTTGFNYRRFTMVNVTIMGTTPASSCSASLKCRTQTPKDPYMKECNSIYAPVKWRRVGITGILNTADTKSCESSMDPRQCRALSPAYASLDCQMPFGVTHHFTKGAGEANFTGVNFAYWKNDDCGFNSRAIAPNPWAAEVQFPIYFQGVTWWESPFMARFGMDDHFLDKAFLGRAKPCNYFGGGCMGFDSWFLYDSDGTLTELGKSPGPIYSKVRHSVYATVMTTNLRTLPVWAPLCNTSVEGETIEANICMNVEAVPFSMISLDRGARDVKYGPLALTPKNNGFRGGVITSVGEFYGVCPCGWDFSPYYTTVRPNTIYRAEVVSLPENFKLSFPSPFESESILLQFYYPSSSAISLYIGNSAEDDLSLKLTTPPTLDSPHGAHFLDTTNLKLYIVMRGGVAAHRGEKDLTLKKSSKISMGGNVVMDADSFSGADFSTNIATMLGISPDRVKVADVKRRRLSATSNKTNIEFELTVEPLADATKMFDPKDQKGAQNAQALELQIVGNMLDNMVTDTHGNQLGSAAGGKVSVEEFKPVAVEDESETAAEADPTMIAEADDAGEAGAGPPGMDCEKNSWADLRMFNKKSGLYIEEGLPDGERYVANCTDAMANTRGNLTINCNAGVLTADVSKCFFTGCPRTGNGFIGEKQILLQTDDEIAPGIIERVNCSNFAEFYIGHVLATCVVDQNGIGHTMASTQDCRGPCNTSASVNLSLSGEISLFTSPRNMAPGETMKATDCSAINQQFNGEISVKCAYGTLFPDYSGCRMNECRQGDMVTWTLDGKTGQERLDRNYASGSFGTFDCSEVSNLYSGSGGYYCWSGKIYVDLDGCHKFCQKGSSVTVTLGSQSQEVVTNSDVSHQDFENHDCSIFQGWSGSFRLSCDDGNLRFNTRKCQPMSCRKGVNVSVALNGITYSYVTENELGSGESLQVPCSELGEYPGVLQLDCDNGEYKTHEWCSGSCATGQAVFPTLGGTREVFRIPSGMESMEKRTYDCGSINSQWDGQWSTECYLGLLINTNTTGCEYTACATNSLLEVLINGTSYTLTTQSDLDDGLTRTESCPPASGAFGQVEYKCEKRSVELLSSTCKQEAPCLQRNVKIQHNLAGTMYEYDYAMPTEGLKSRESATGSCSLLNSNLTGSFKVTCYESIVGFDTTGCRSKDTAAPSPSPSGTGSSPTPGQGGSGTGSSPTPGQGGSGTGSSPTPAPGGSGTGSSPTPAPAQNGSTTPAQNGSTTPAPSGPGADPEIENADFADTVQPPAAAIMVIAFLRLLGIF